MNESFHSYKDSDCKSVASSTYKTLDFSEDSSIVKDIDDFFLHFHSLTTLNEDWKPAKQENVRVYQANGSIEDFLTRNIYEGVTIRSPSRASSESVNSSIIEEPFHFVKTISLPKLNNDKKVTWNDASTICTNTTMETLTPDKKKFFSDEIPVDPWLCSYPEMKFSPLNGLHRLHNLKIILCDILFRFILVGMILYLLAVIYELIGRAVIVLIGDWVLDISLKLVPHNNPAGAFSVGVLVGTVSQDVIAPISMMSAIITKNKYYERHISYFTFGMNIGVTFTGFMVSVMCITSKDKFRRCFGTALISYAFKLLSVLILLPLEGVVDMIYHLADGVLEYASFLHHADVAYFMRFATTFIVQKIFQVDYRYFGDHSCREDKSCRILKTNCVNDTSVLSSIMKDSQKHIPCSYIMYPLASNLKDKPTALILLGFTLLIWWILLISLMKILSCMINGQFANFIRNKSTNGGCGIPFLVVFCSVILSVLCQNEAVILTLIILIASRGVLNRHWLYFTIIGIDIGQSIGVLFWSLASNEKPLKKIVLINLFINVLGGIAILSVYQTMELIVHAITGISNIIHRMRWISFIIIVFMYFLIPIIFISLSIYGPVYFLAFVIPTLILISVPIIIYVIQQCCPCALPKTLKNWSFLPTKIASADDCPLCLEKVLCWPRKEKKLSRYYNRRRRSDPVIYWEQERVFLYEWDKTATLLRKNSLQH